MIFEQLFLLLLGVWVSRKIFQRLRLPPLLGEVAVGLLLGPVFFGWVQPSPELKLLADLGIFFLMFHVGLELDPKDLFQHSKQGVIVALMGILCAFIPLFLMARGFAYDLFTSVFIALTLSLSALAITARIFKDYKIYDTPLAHLAMTASVLTEIILLIVFSVFLPVAKTGGGDAFSIFYLSFKSLLYFVLVFYIGHRHINILHKIFYQGNKVFTFSIIMALGFGVLAELMGLHLIIGAFLAGLFLREEIIEPGVFKKIEDRIFGLSYSFLGPIFFATLAFYLDFSIFQTMPWFIILVFLVSVFGKMLGAGLAALFLHYKQSEAGIIGLALNCRGAVELIIATIGYEEGLIDAKVYSLLVIVSLATIVVTLGGMKIAGFTKWLHAEHGASK